MHAASYHSSSISLATLAYVKSASIRQFADSGTSTDCSAATFVPIGLTTTMGRFASLDSLGSLEELSGHGGSVLIVHSLDYGARIQVHASKHNHS
jgi:hypothetical protein